MIFAVKMIMRAHKLLLILLFSLTSAVVSAQVNYCAEAKKITSLMRNEHLEPLELNDTLSQRVFSTFLSTIDQARVYFTADEFHALEKFKYEIDDNIKSGKCSFLKQANLLLEPRLKSTLNYLDVLKTIPFDYKATNYYQTYENHELVFPNTEKDRLDRVKDRVVLKTLSKIVSDIITDSSTTLPDSAFKNEKAIRSQVIEKMKCHINLHFTTPEILNTYLGESFLNAIAKSYDPHSSYFNNNQKKTFDLFVSRESKTFGFFLEDDDNGDLMVSELSPGGPAWKSNLIHENDLLIGITWKNKTTYDMTCATSDGINHVLNTTSNQTATFKFKKPDGSIFTIELNKEILRIDENTIKSFVIEGTKKVGYINIPSFYADDEGQYAKGCANDVAKELLKLKRENIQGVIVDLRFNGGGSLKEAIDLSGIFIDEGPICLMEQRNAGVQPLKDFNRGKIYNGPLVILVNTFSASASEIVAASLQDYQRAIIIGENTFGKATGQVILPLDTVYNNIDELANSAYEGTKSYAGFLKITNMKFYRINQASNQGVGVKPDIVLPSIWHNYDLKEANRPYYIKGGITDKKSSYTLFTNLPLNQIKDKSNARVNSSPKFKQLNELAKNTVNVTKYPLNANDFWKYTVTENNEINTFQKLIESQHHLTVKNNANDAIFIEMDELLYKVNNLIIEDIKSDIFIEEAYFVISDLIDINN